MNSTAFFKFSIFLIVITSFSFSEKQIVGPPSKNYDLVKTDINSQRKKFKTAFDAANSSAEKNKILTEAGNYFLKSMCDSVFPYWYGTKWDFNGYTDKPSEGQVACGYFVSTTLKHCGFNLNRFRLAQKYSVDIVKILNSNDSLITHRGISAAQFIQRTQNKLKDGLYVVGLDYHVGFLLYEKGEVYFIHSSYRDPVAVVKEKASTSLALNDSKVFIVCNISGNKKLMEKWISSTEIKIN